MGFISIHTSLCKWKNIENVAIGNALILVDPTFLRRIVADFGGDADLMLMTNGNQQLKNLMLEFIASKFNHH